MHHNIYHLKTNRKMYAKVSLTTFTVKGYFIIFIFKTIEHASSVAEYNSIFHETHTKTPQEDMSPWSKLSKKYTHIQSPSYIICYFSLQ